MSYISSADSMTDAYKIGMSQLHSLSVFGSVVEIVNSYSNFTPRKNAYMKFSPYSDGTLVVYGTRETFQTVVSMWDQTFFDVAEEVAISKLTRRTRNLFGSVAEHSKYINDMRSLWKLGYLPIEVRAIDEGTHYPIGLPVFTVEATIDGYGWLVNYIETLTSGLIWPMINTATKVEQFYLQAKHFGEISAPKEVVDMWLPICVHEFGMRGYRGPEDQVRTSSAHSLFFLGSDTCAVIDFFEDNYDANSDLDPIAVSVRASEHADISRMLSLFRHIAQEQLAKEGPKYTVVADLLTEEEQANFKISTLGEFECVRGYRGQYFINEDETPKNISVHIANPQDLLDNTELYVLEWFILNSTGIMSYVSDTENYYRLINVYAKRLRYIIEHREAREDGQPPIFVFRPDSSRRSPLTVICGYKKVNEDGCHDAYRDGSYCLAWDEYIEIDGKYYIDEHNGTRIEISKEEVEGSLVSLWNTFGGETVSTEAGLMKLINPAVGIIYGEAISQHHQLEIYDRMLEMGFSAVNVLMGKGSYASLEGSTRDLFSMSYKQTFSEAIVDGKRVSLAQQKTPIGDVSKTSAKGLLQVDHVDGSFVLNQDVTLEVQQTGCLTVLLRNGTFHKTQSLNDIKGTYAKSY